MRRMRPTTLNAWMLLLAGMGPLFAGLGLARAQSQPSVLGLPEKAMASNGTLMICGGGRTPEEIFDEFVRLAGGKEGRVVLIPSAKTYSGPDDLQRRFNGWQKYELSSFGFLDAASRDQADDDEFVRPLSEATGVWISGGAQGRLANLYGGTKVEAALRQVMERGGVIGGISAGAAIMSRVMIQYGTPAEAVVGRGFGLLEQAVVDQHFSQRGRHTRLLGVLEQHPNMLGLGIDEGTALVVQGNRLRVMGASRATLFTWQDPNQPGQIYRLSANDEAELTVSGPQTEDRRLVVDMKRK